MQISVSITTVTVSSFRCLFYDLSTTQPVSDHPEKTSWKAMVWAGAERCIQTGNMLVTSSGRAFQVFGPLIH